jgi:hypothetical protein
VKEQAMKTLRKTALVLVALVLLAACGGGGHKATPTTQPPPPATSTPPPSTPAPTPALTPGESANLAHIMSAAPQGYSYVDAPKALVDEVQTEVVTDPDLANAIRGFSVHSIVRQSDDTTIGVAVLMDVDSFYTALPASVEKGFMEGLGADQSHTLNIAGATWIKATVNVDGSAHAYVDLKGNVIYTVIGEDPAAIEAFITAAEQMAAGVQV